MVYDIQQDELVSLIKSTSKPHVVILGAGASLAAFPAGDAKGNRLPLMNNLAKVLELDQVLIKAGHDITEDFEKLYNQLYSRDPDADIVKLIQKRVEDYFSQLVLPRHQTLYDLLILSLRPKDAIFTFNWDPFLVDAYERCARIVDSPRIYHLHGNVRVAFCEKCNRAMQKAESCHICGCRLNPSILIYPVEPKKYTDPFIKTQWDQRVLSASV